MNPVTHDDPLLQRLRAGDWAMCLPIRVSRSIQVLLMARAAGFHAVYFDMEHSPIALDEVAALSLAALQVGIAPLVRVPASDSEHLARCLDGGASGVIVPHVDTAAQARAIVEVARFRPRGVRALAGATPLLGYAPLTADDASALLEARTIVIAMIESLAAVANADAIAAVDGIDLLLVGSGDLSDELGVHGRSDDPRIRLAFETVAAACRRHGRWLGVAGIKRQPELIRELRALGASFITSSTDESVLLAGLREEARALRESFGSAPTPQR